MSSQFVKSRGKWWHCIVGIATGLAAGSILANVYLQDMDVMAAKYCQLLLRFLDDTLMLANDEDIAAAVNAANAFHPSIRWEAASSGTKDVVFIDVHVLGVAHQRTQQVLIRVLQQLPSHDLQEDNRFGENPQSHGTLQEPGNRCEEHQPPFQEVPRQRLPWGTPAAPEG